MEPGRKEEEPVKVGGGIRRGLAGEGIFPGGIGHAGSPPVHLRIVFLPQHPYFAGVVGKQVLAWEA